jgi:lipid-A-disaccharide synthase
LNKSLFIFAGERSGDLQGAAILKALKSNYSISAVAGPLMREYPLFLIEPMESFQVMGAIDILFHIRKLLSLFYKVRKHILETKPDVVLLIDYQDFNLLLAKSLRKAGYKGKIGQVVCPTVWAWRKKRVRSLEENFDHLFCLFPFEPSLFPQKKLKVSYIGHPLLQIIPPLPQDVKREPLILLFPGSRRKEVERNLPLQLKAAEKFRQAHPEFNIAISVSNSDFHIKSENYILFPSSENYNMMKKGTLAIAKSGTINLELALHEVPTVVTYQMSRFDYLLGKYLLRIQLPHFCIVNYLLNHRLFPEHYGIVKEELVYIDLEKMFEAKTLKSAKCKELFTLFGNKKGAEEIVQSL